MYCPRCGQNDELGNKFCVACGANLMVSHPDTTAVLPDLGGDTGSRQRFVRAETLLEQVIDGKYRLNRTLGIGGMGAVYRATRIHIGDEVAVKILHPDGLAGASSGERFRAEAKIAALLKHPNAVSIYDFGVTANGLMYLVMELVEGSTLRQVIEDQSPLGIRVVVEITSQVCAALDEAHRVGIVHRDIKPENIVVSAVAGGVHVKVLDFGVAKMRDSATGNLTQAGMVVGTPRYMSPEQCVGEELDGRSDIYSFGIVLYEMLCGTVPFNSPTPTAVVVQHVTQAPSSLRAVNIGISRSIETVVLRALSKKREERPQSAGELAQQLKAAIRGDSSPAQSYSSGSDYQPAITQSGFENSSGEVLTADISSRFPTGGRPFMAPSSTGRTTAFGDGIKPAAKSPLIVGGIVAIIVLLLATVVALVFFLPKSAGNGNSVPSVSSRTEPPQTANRSQPTVSAADTEFIRLREKMLNATATQRNEVSQELVTAQNQYPIDYRFSYQRAKLFVDQGKDHDETFAILFAAAKTAIVNNNAPAMLSDLDRDKSTSFSRLTDHDEWPTLLNALTRNDPSTLSLSHH